MSNLKNRFTIRIRRPADKKIRRVRVFEFVYDVLGLIGFIRMSTLAPNAGCKI